MLEGKIRKGPFFYDSILLSNSVKGEGSTDFETRRICNITGYTLRNFFVATINLDATATLFVVGAFFRR